MRPVARVHSSPAFVPAWQLKKALLCGAKAKKHHINFVWPAILNQFRPWWFYLFTAVDRLGVQRRRVCKSGSVARVGFRDFDTKLWMPTRFWDVLSICIRYFSSLEVLFILFVFLLILQFICYC
jgi:hypothetical protein